MLHSRSLVMKISSNRSLQRTISYRIHRLRKNMMQLEDSKALRTTTSIEEVGEVSPRARVNNTNNMASTRTTRPERSNPTSSTIVMVHSTGPNPSKATKTGKRPRKTTAATTIFTRTIDEIGRKNVEVISSRQPTRNSKRKGQGRTDRKLMVTFMDSMDSREGQVVLDHICGLDTSYLVLLWLIHCLVY